MFNFKRKTSVTNDALHHLHYFHVNFKSLVMKEQHPNNIDTMEQHSKMLGLRKICIPNPPQRQLFFCLHFIPTLNKFISHIWYIASCLLWFSYDPCVICFIPNACFKLKNDIWPISIIKTWKESQHYGQNEIKEATNGYFILILHIFFPQNNFFIRMIFFLLTCYEKLLWFPQ